MMKRTIPMANTPTKAANVIIEYAQPSRRSLTFFK